MKKLPVIALFLITIFCLLLVSTVFVSPISLSAQESDPEPTNPSSKSSLDTNRSSQAPRAIGDNAVDDYINGFDDVAEGNDLFVQEPGSEPANPSSKNALDITQSEQSPRALLDNAPDGFLYALRDVNGGGNLIYGFKADALSGALTLLPGFPVTSGGLGKGNPVTELLAYDPVYARLFVVNNGSDSISVFSVNEKDGSLTELSYSPFLIAAGLKGCIAVHPSGSPLIVGSAQDDSVASFKITATSATEATGSPFLTSEENYSCAFSQDGAYVYVGGDSGSDITGFGVNKKTGVLTLLSGSPFASGAGNPLAYVTDDAGRLFTANFGSNQVRAFTSSAGNLTAVSGNPFTSGLGEATHGIRHPAGYYMVADRSGDQVGVYNIAGSGSATTLSSVTGSPFASGGSSTSILALSRTGAFLYAANGSSRNITTFDVNAGTGALISAVTQPADTLGNSGRITGLAFAPKPEKPEAEGGFVYTLQDKSGASNKIFGFQVDSSTGILNALPGFPIDTGSFGTAHPVAELMTYDRTNSRLFVVNNGSDTISVYSVDREDGGLTELSYSPFSIAPGLKGCIAVHSLGSPLVVGNAANDSVASFKITASSATEAAGSPFLTSEENFSCAFSRDGAYVYVGGDSGTAISGFAVNQATAVLTPLAGSPFESGAGFPLAYVTDGRGRILTANFSSNQVRAFTSSSGILTAVTGNPFTSGLGQAIYGMRHKSGHYLVADRSGNQVGVYKVAGNGPATTLTAVSGSPFDSGGSSTSILAKNDDQKYVFAANSSSRNITSFTMDPDSGSLSGVSVQPINTIGNINRVTGMAYVPPMYKNNLPLIIDK